MRSIVSVLVFLVVLSSCAKKDDSTSDSEYDGVTCSTTVTSNLSASDFVALLQSGTSSSSPFIACIAAGVSINSDASSTISLPFQYLKIQGNSNSTSTLTNITIRDPNQSNSITFSRVKIIGSSASGIASTSGGSNNVTLSLVNSILSSTSEGITISAGGSGTYTLSLSNSTISAGSTAVSMNAGGDGTYNLTVSSSTVTSSGSGFIMGQGGSGDYVADIEGTSITSQGSAIDFSAAGSPNITTTLGNLTLKSNGTTTGTYTAIALSMGGAGTITVNSGSSTKSLVCNVSGSSATFTQILSTTAGVSSTASGTFSVASNTSNGSNSSISICP